SGFQSLTGSPDPVNVARPHVDDDAMDPCFGQALEVGQSAGRSDEELLGIATRAGVGLTGDSDQPAEPWPSRGVHAVSHPTGELGHLRAEATDDDGRWTLGTQEPGHARDTPRPHRPQPVPRLLDPTTA